MCSKENMRNRECVVAKMYISDYKIREWQGALETNEAKLHIL